MKDYIEDCEEIRNEQEHDTYGSNKIERITWKIK